MKKLKRILIKKYDIEVALFLILLGSSVLLLMFLGVIK